MTYKTEQENFWAGEFGDEYIDRNYGEKLLSSNINFFCNALKATKNIENCIEFGANIGMNLRALKILFPNLEATAIEINKKAILNLSEIVPRTNIHEGSILDFDVNNTWDLVLIKGVLIHINPDELKRTYDKLVLSCKRYLLVAEYYNPTPVTISYRGHGDRLFKRDFAGEILQLHPEMNLIDYGFVYRGDPKFPQDDITWFLMEKNTICK